MRFLCFKKCKKRAFYKGKNSRDFREVASFQALWRADHWAPKIFFSRKGFKRPIIPEKLVFPRKTSSVSGIIDKKALDTKKSENHLFFARDLPEV